MRAHCLFYLQIYLIHPVLLPVFSVDYFLVNNRVVQKEKRASQFYLFWWAISNNNLHFEVKIPKSHSTTFCFRKSALEIANWEPLKSIPFAQHSRSCFSNVSGSISQLSWDSIASRSFRHSLRMRQPSTGQFWLWVALEETDENEIKIFGRKRPLFRDGHFVVCL